MNKKKSAPVKSRATPGRSGPKNRARPKQKRSARAAKSATRVAVAGDASGLRQRHGAGPPSRTSHLGAATSSNRVVNSRAEIRCRRSRTC